MSTNIENLKALIEEERKKLEEAQRLVKQAILKAMASPPKIEDQEAAVKAFDTANKQAHDVYLKIDELNKAKSDEASKNYHETCKVNNAKVESGAITPEECEKLNDEAYDEYMRIKEANDKASMDAYKEYQELFNENGTKLKTVQEHYQKHNPSPPPVTATVQSEKVSGLVAAYKELYKDDDEWYKKHEPKIEGNRTSLTFKSDEDALNFAKKLAENQNFIMIDKETNKVLAYSRDGKLFRGDKELTEGPLRPSKEEMEKLPTLDEYQKKQQTPNPTDDPPLSTPQSTKPEPPEIPTVQQTEESPQEKEDLEKQKGINPNF
ncbi:hypothetical protein [Legionella tucsonensis]|uniref:Substrate of the Dot/Icm secretion system n=1 Tax=Legionella tucsonensis TaxID=40335 RepID=A0A0W0ZUM0_9GAMM|nr:hypothetical protein [Legionella tucsonensis]KTD72601.1 substrate of the Dot/Icm secretion system [Legionella tucsonensis]